MRNLKKMDLSLVGATIIEPREKPKVKLELRSNWYEVERVPNRFAGKIILAEDDGKFEALVIAAGPDVKNCAVGDYVVAQNISDVTYAGHKHFLGKDEHGNVVAVVLPADPEPGTDLPS